MQEQLIREVGAGVVVRAFQGGGDVENAWDVLAQAVGGSEGERLVRKACDDLGVDPEPVLDAAYRNRLHA